MAKQRIYAVIKNAPTEDKVEALVLAANKSQALAHWAKRTASAAIASQHQLIAATKAGVTVETANEEPNE